MSPPIVAPARGTRFKGNLNTKRARKKKKIFFCARSQETNSKPYISAAAVDDFFLFPFFVSQASRSLSLFLWARGFDGMKRIIAAAGARIRK